MKRIAIIGCGFVANYYMLTLSKSQTLKVVGVLDTIRERSAGLAKKYSVPTIYNSIDELLADGSIEIVLNLTNPRDHFELTRKCLESGKHVYSEKPLAMTMDEANELVRIAQNKSLQLSSAPCSMLGEAAQTVWKAVRENKVGKVRLVYAEIDDDLVHKAGLDNLYTSLGSPWPAKDEFEIGCTLEHAGYYLPWLVAMFGPAKSVTAFATALIPDKMPGVKLSPPDAPDLTVACIEFHSGTVARLTCSIVAPHDHSMRLFGDAGVIHVEETWDYGTDIRVQPRDWNRNSLRTPLNHLAMRVWRRMTRHIKALKIFEKFASPHGPRIPLVRPVPEFNWEMGLHMDFSRGIQEMAEAIDEKRDSRLSAQFSLHINELALAIHNARNLKQPYEMTTTIPAVQPMPWAI